VEAHRIVVDRVNGGWRGRRQARSRRRQHRDAGAQLEPMLGRDPRLQQSDVDGGARLNVIPGADE
jgi:hypothetical protein